MARKHTLVQAIHLATSGKSRDMASASYVLDGVPVGGWGQTSQAWQQLEELLPLRRDRGYTIDHFVDAMYGESGSGSGRYYRRSTEEALDRAARIEASKA